MRAHPLQADYIWGSAEFESKYPGYKIIDLLKGISAVWRIGADFDSLELLPHKTVAACRDKVLLIPGSAGRVKYWPARHWFALARELEKDDLDCLVLGQPEKSDIVAELTGLAAAKMLNYNKGNESHLLEDLGLGLA
ncbi:MAG: glycosyltransferase family 9 protein [Candidatus Obscuribacter sp.]|nr:glycosyltransferase family 9 protein [Candidatus Obscuribacter sp.]